MSEQTQRTLLYKTGEGEFQIKLPIGARFTFGPALPYQKKEVGYGSNRNEYSIRIYAGKTNDSLVAVITGVYEVRDIDIPLAKLVVREQGKSVWKSDDEGYTVETSANKSKTWKDATEIKLLNEGE